MTIEGSMDVTARSVRPLAASDATDGIVGRFRDVVAGQPGALAVADDATELTFAAVAAEAARVLAGVRTAVSAFTPPAERGGPDVFGGLEPVAVLHAHDVWAVAALLGVIASGHPVLVL